MRLLAIEIEEFRSIKDQWLPADGLVVLFGPNSAGKTFVLEAASELLRHESSRRFDHANSRRIDPGVQQIIEASGSVVFSLPDAGTNGSPDAELYRKLLNGHYVDGTVWYKLAPDAADVLEGKAAEEAREWIAARFAAAGTGPDPDRELLARAMLEHTAVFFVAGDDEVCMYADATWLPDGVCEAAARIAAGGGDDDPLREIAEDLVADQEALIGSVADLEAFANAFAPVIVLDGDTESMSEELREAVAVVHNLLWDPRGLDGGWRLTDGFVDPYRREAGWPTFGRLVADSWLERMTDSGEPECSTPISRYGQAANWYRVRPSIIAAAALIAAEANRVAPGFLRGQGEIGVEVLPVSVWRPEDRRIRVTFTGRDGEPRDLRVVGAGTARWAAAAVQLACRRLRMGRRVVTGQGGLAVSDPAAVREILQAAWTRPHTQADVRLEPADAPGVYVIDEPEAHLHPSAIVSVRAWIEKLAQTATAVLTATHSPMLLDTDSLLTTRILVLPGETGTELQHVTGPQDDLLAEVADELGITRGDLLLMTRLAVFVEGPHEVIIFTEWFGAELRDAGIRVFPAHGADNFGEITSTNPGLAGSEIVAALGIRLATVSDARPSGAKRIAREALQVNREVIALSLAEEDILFYLDEEVCRKEASGFPGWRAAYAAGCRAGPRRKWKKWITDTYGLDLSRENIRRLAVECSRQGRIPRELTQLVSDLKAAAASRTP